MSMSELNELVAALSQAQSEFDPVLKDSTNPAFKSKYADMASVIRATQPALAKNGLVIIQFPISNVAEQQAGIRTILAHKSGQFIESEYMLPALMHGNRFDAQSCGSAFTYARRYSYQAAVGVAGEDDDGNSAVGMGTKEAAQSVAVDKLRTHANGDESIVLREQGDGNLLLIEGPGLPILRAAISNLERGLVQLIVQGDKWLIPAGKAFDLEAVLKEINKRDKTKLTQQFSMASPAPLGVAGGNGGESPFRVNAPQGEPEQSFPLPPSMGYDAEDIIKGAKRKSGTSKDKKTGKPKDWSLLEVLWRGQKYVCWHESCWQHIEMNIGKPARFIETPSWDGKASPTIDAIISIGGIPYMDGMPVVQQELR